MNPIVNLAKKAAKNFILKKKTDFPLKSVPQSMIKKRAGVFVSIHHKDGKLRGCIGTFLPTQKNLAEEIVTSAISSTQDPRFPPIKKEELPYLTFKVDVLSELKPAKKRDLDPKKFGLMVTDVEGRRGLLLPDLPGVITADQQIEICKRKAGIGLTQPVDFQIFTVKRYEENK